ncbi:GNAT family N-acetyltransferase [Marinifilum caeruleilacunae]|uniref:GNAT family N-acetyltransferase n=1 Tax=Marinifilum caeruleilacunae TaxID=2499076 RepID=A0ABX1WVE9_9BACT|nr:GNAT family N-acetyltransferase [Marinifilum caeruleilacunae]NOU60078.1 GNAT family N-acetyltransferase [Marinifilum caeruleilacunae]
MKEIIPPVPREELEKELTEERFVRKTNKGSNEIYSFTHHDSPNLMREVGRLREITFRKAGGGTGKEIDIDKFDIDEKPYHQLIVWDPKAREILGGYRYILCKDAPVDENGDTYLATSRLFEFSEDFKKNYMPHTIELGRSFVQPDYQSIKKGRKSLYALDNLWDGLGSLIIDYPEIKYFFGKVTMYPDYNRDARNHILYFMDKMFNDPDNLATPTTPLVTNMDEEKLAKDFCHDTFEENYKVLSQNVRSNGENIPPLINAYMGLSPTMKCFGTAVNKHFGDVEETGIMITISDVYDQKIDRHTSSYLSFLKIKLPKKPNLGIFKKK